MKLKYIQIVVILFGFAIHLPEAKENENGKGHLLFFFPMITKSAKITFMPVAEKMAERGHQVTVVMPYPSKGTPIKNLREIIIEWGDISKMMANFSTESWTRNEESGLQYLKNSIKFFETNIKSLNDSMGQPNIKEIWSPNSPKVDIVISMPNAGNEISYFLAYKLNATMVIWSSQQNPMSIYDDAIGQPHNPAYIGNFFTTYRHPMSFRERLGNTFAKYLLQWVNDIFMVQKLEYVIDYHFPGNVGRPSLHELKKNTGLALQFGHPLIMDGIRPMAPNFINVGMMNCRPANKLPENLEKIINDSGDDGVILVSFGSVLKASTMPEAKRQMLVNVFRRLKQRILWKWETEVMEDKSENVFLSQWLPQPDILAHPKLRLFISHGGQSSCQESLCHQKPMVVVPVFGDQPANGKEAMIKGYGESVAFTDITEESLYEAIRKVLDDPKYSRRAKEHGNLLMDDINKPMDRAIWWLEYALRHPGMAHLRSPMHDMAWYRLMLLDVIAFLFSIVFLLTFSVYATFKCLFCRSSKSLKKPKSD